MTKKGALTAIVVWSVVVVLLLIVLIIGATLNMGGFSLKNRLPVFFSMGERQDISSYEEDGTEIKGVDIAWRSGHVQVDSSVDDRIRLKQTSRYGVEPLELDISDGRLTIRENRSFWSVLSIFGNGQSDLELYLPQKQYDEFVMVTTSGKTELTGISAEKIGLKLTSGRLIADNLQAKNISASMTSGVIEAEDMKAESIMVKMTSGRADFEGTFDDIGCKSTSGTLTIKTDVVPKKLEAKMTSGKIAITIPDNDGFSLLCKKSSGSLKSDFKLSSILDGGEDSYTYGIGADSGRDYYVNITSGRFELVKAE